MLIQMSGYLWLLLAKLSSEYLRYVNAKHLSSKICFDDSEHAESFLDGLEVLCLCY